MSTHENTKQIRFKKGEQGQVVTTFMLRLVVPGGLLLLIALALVSTISQPSWQQDFSEAVSSLAQAGPIGNSSSVDVVQPAVQAQETRLEALPLAPLYPLNGNIVATNIAEEMDKPLEGEHHEKINDEALFTISITSTPGFCRVLLHFFKPFRQDGMSFEDDLANVDETERFEKNGPCNLMDLIRAGHNIGRRVIEATTATEFLRWIKPGLDQFYEAIWEAGKALGSLDLPGYFNIFQKIP